MLLNTYHTALIHASGVALLTVCQRKARERVEGTKGEKRGRRQSARQNQTEKRSEKKVQGEAVRSAHVDRSGIILKFKNTMDLE